MDVPAERSSCFHLVSLEPYDSKNPRFQILHSRYSLYITLSIVHQVTWPSNPDMPHRQYADAKIKVGLKMRDTNAGLAVSISIFTKNP